MEKKKKKKKKQSPRNNFKAGPWVEWENGYT